jgi:hypothetical protein
MLSKLGRPESVDDVELYLVEGGGKQLKLRRIGVGAAQRAPGE